MPLPFDDEGGTDTVSDVAFDRRLMDRAIPRFRITLNRLVSHGVTPGCEGCTTLASDKPKLHTDECKRRFAGLLHRTPLEAVAEDSRGSSLGTSAPSAPTQWSKISYF